MGTISPPMTSSRESSKTGLRLIHHIYSFLSCCFFQLHYIHLALLCVSRLQFEARNQKKEAKEMAVIEAMKRREQQEQPEDASQAAR